MSIYAYVCNKETKSESERDREKEICNRAELVSTKDMMLKTSIKKKRKREAKKGKQKKTNK